MTDKSKSAILRPKVRFSQSAESPDAARAFTKPKIRSVVRLHGPSVKILKAPPSDFDKTHGTQETGRDSRHSAGDAPNDLSLCPSKSAAASAPCLTEITLTPENRALRSKNVFDLRDTSEIEETRVAPSKSCPNEIAVEAKLSSSQNVSCGKSSKGGRKSCSSLADGTKRSGKNESCAGSLSQTGPSNAGAGKENFCVVRESRNNASAVSENSARTRSEAEGKGAANCRGEATAKETLRKAKESLSEAKEASGKVKETLSKSREAACKPQEASCRTKETSHGATKLRADPLRKSVKEIGLMPCMKNAKARGKSAPMKKTVIRDVSSSRTNVYVGPGVHRRRSPEAEIRLRTTSARSRSEILSGDKLSRPEYNSIVGTIKKLRDLREDKVTKDLDQLPAVYRGLVNGKVSSALDFGANEAIYRDLVDLTIDEKQLPSRLTRSKDPEPRQRDLVPKLTDFFVPTNDEEYRKAVLPRPPSPRIFDVSNPYKISDRIFAWKESLDHDL